MNFPTLNILVLSLACAGAAAAGQESQQTQAPANQGTASAPSFHEEVIAELSPGSEMKGMLMNEHHVYWFEKQGSNHMVKMDGKQQGGVFQELGWLNTSLDGAHFAFWGKRNSKWILVTDGHEGTQEYTKGIQPWFQPGRSSLAYGACGEKKKCRLAVDGTETGAEYDDVSYPQYSRDGNRLVYFGRRGKKWTAIVNGKEVGPALEDFSNFGFSSEGGRFFVAGKINRWLLSMYFVDGETGPPFQVFSNITFSSDGKQFAYGGTMSPYGKFTNFKKKKVYGTVVVDGRPTATYEGRGLAGTWTGLVLFGQEQEIVQGFRALNPDFDGISSPAFSHEGKLVYAVRRDKGDFAVMVGGEPGPGFEEILSPIVFTEDRQHFVYVAKRGDEFVEVRDNAPGRSLPAGSRGPTAVPWIAFSKDAVHVAYETAAERQSSREGGVRAMRSAVIDGKEGPKYEALDVTSFAFDKEGHHYFYMVQGTKGKESKMIIDGHESRPYDELGGTHFLEDGKTVTFFARDGSKFLRVSYAVE